MSAELPTLNDPPPAAGRSEAIGPGSVCLGCTYDLTGLMPHGQCPECGKPIAESLSGDLLAFADAEWLRRTHRGLRRVTRAVLLPVLFACLSIIGAVLLSVAVDSATPSKAVKSFISGLLMVLFWINVVVLACAPFVGLHGWFTATTLEPGRHDERADRVRRFVRWSAVVWLALTLASLGGLGSYSLVGPGAGTYAFWMSWSVLAAAAAFHYWYAMSFVRLLANRVPAPRLTRQARTARFGLVIATTAGMLVCGLGPIGAFIYYLAVIDTAHSSLKPVVRRRGQV